MCGYCRPSVACSAPPLTSSTLSALDDRLLHLHSTAASTTYAKQKDSLHRQLSRFLSSLPGYKTPFNATAKNSCRFLAWNDSCGKAHVHKLACPHLGKHGRFPCGCPVRLAYATVDSYIGKLRAIFKLLGRDGDWNASLGLENPAAPQIVKDYLNAFTMEQLQAAITPRHATPLFPSKLALLMNFIKREMTVPGISPTRLFVLARDFATFPTLFLSADRANDFSLDKTQEILRLPGDQGFLFNHVWGRILRDGSSNMFGLRRHSNAAICPVKARELYVSISSPLGVNLSNGFLLRPVSPRGGVINKQISTSAMQDRLRIHLQHAGIFNGETLQSFRVGAALTLALSGSQLADIMSARWLALCPHRFLLFKARSSSASRWTIWISLLD